MRRAIAADFAAVPGVRVVMTVDPRLPSRRHRGRGPETVRRRRRDVRGLAGRGSIIPLLIAPETGGVLEGLTRAIIEAGGRPLGSEPDADRA